jgi:hypothetical protein
VTLPSGPEPPASAVEQQIQSDRESGRLQSLFAASRGFVRIVYRDPEHLSERLTLALRQRIGEPSLAWAQTALADRGPEGRPAIATRLSRRSTHVSRIDGAVAGTPFLIALVPGYVGHLWQEGVLVFRLAALYGRDPRAMQTAAEFLYLRGIHPDPEAAHIALEHVAAIPMPDRPDTRRPIVNWYRSVRMLGVFGGFLSPPSGDEKPQGLARLRTLAGLLVAGALWAITWIFPVTFMLAMSWGCESHCRALGRRATAFYSGQETEDELESEERAERRLVRTITIVLSVAVPVAFVAFADHVRNQTGINAWGAAGAIVALSLVVAMTVVARRA